MYNKNQASFPYVFSRFDAALWHLKLILASADVLNLTRDLLLSIIFRKA